MDLKIRVFLLLVVLGIVVRNGEGNIELPCDPPSGLNYFSKSFVVVFYCLLCYHLHAEIETIRFLKHHNTEESRNHAGKLVH